ncbi:MAG: hypothetical protein WBL97_19405 [Candidatus Sulfotelmatobacter sp.]
MVSGPPWRVVANATAAVVSPENVSPIIISPDIAPPIISPPIVAPWLSFIQQINCHPLCSAQ